MLIKLNSFLPKGLLFLGLLAVVGVMVGFSEKQAMASEMESTVGIEFTDESAKTKLPVTGGEKADIEVPDNDSTKEVNHLPQTGENQRDLDWFLIGIVLIIIAFMLPNINQKKVNKKFQTLNFGLFSSLILLFLMSPIKVEAADGGQNITEGDIGFQKNTDITPPVDPLDPAKPLKPIKPPTSGPLSLNYVSDIKFGSYDIGDSETIFYASLDSIEYADSSEKELKRPNFVELTDNRGLNTGWRLIVKQNGPFKNENGAELTGAQLAFKNTTIVSLDEITATPTGFSKELITLNDSQNVPVLAAESGTGMGSWSINFGQGNTEGENSILLTVPKGAVKEKGHYTTNLTWTLSDSI